MVPAHDTHAHAGSELNRLAALDGRVHAGASNA
jgi:hypothetical protein